MNMRQHKHRRDAFSLASTWLYNLFGLSERGHPTSMSLLGLSPRADRTDNSGTMDSALVRIGMEKMSEMLLNEIERNKMKSIWLVDAPGSMVSHERMVATNSIVGHETDFTLPAMDFSGEGTSFDVDIKAFGKLAKEETLHEPQKYRVAKKSTGEIVDEFDTMAEAMNAIDKAKKAKKATLVLV